MKSKILFIGNCQNTGILHFLKKSDEFNRNFDIKTYANWQLIENQCEIPMSDITSADVFVCQPLRPVHECYSTDPTVEGSIGSYVRESCLKITYPYIFSSAMWPIVQAGQNQNRWFGGEVLDNLVINQGLSKNDIFNLFLKNEIDWNYRNRFNESIKILKTKESITNIKVSDFIINNYTKNLLFLIPQHPTSLIFLYVANQILSKLNISQLSYDLIENINDADIEDSTYNLSSKMFPLHQSAINDYKFTFGQEYTQDSVNFYLQRINTYLQWNHQNA
jgi:hypothetical protein